MIKKLFSPGPLSRRLAAWGNLLVILALVLGGLAQPAAPAKAAGALSVEIIAGYNLVVDSNVESPSTYAPSVATVIGKFCNTGDAALTGVQGFIGDYTANTPGTYPGRNSADGSFIAQHPHLANTGYYAFTHIGGRIGARDASRYVGTLQPGECKVQYWHFTYPRRGNPNNTGPAVWGATNDPNDDLWLKLNVWGTSAEGSGNNAEWTMTMRNEISAMANKIYPNGASWFNTNADHVNPGDTITSNGVMYRLGVVNQGFDNDGDLAYDYNAWLQPIGDPSYDPSCFRLIETWGTITVSRSGGLPDKIINFTDNLYFTNLPDDNNGVLGEVHYKFLALDGPCSTSLTPYQESASGADNEKFNGDYGAGIPPVGSADIDVTIDKSGTPASVTAGGTISYTIPFQNNGSTSAGLPLNNVPLVISDTIPTGLQYVGGTAGTLTSYGGSATILFSYDGINWTQTPTSTALVKYVQAWLNDPLPGGEAGTFAFQVSVPAGYSGSAMISNQACASFGTTPSFDCASTGTLLQGSNIIGDLVWRDENGNGVPDTGEAGISGAVVKLYYDQGTVGTLDSSDTLIMTTTTNASGGYSFTTLPNGSFVVVVESSDAAIPYGYTTTTSNPIFVTGLGTTITSPYNDADFGFGPALRLEKKLAGSSPVYEGDLITYTLILTNTRPGNGSGSGSTCAYTIWAAALDATHTGGSNAWTNPTRAFGVYGPDGLYASTAWANTSDLLAGTSFKLGGQNGTIQKVEALYSVYLGGASLTNDYVDLTLWYSDTSVVTVRRITEWNAFGLGPSKQGTLVWDVTSARTWKWTDFSNYNGTLVDMQLSAVKDQGKDGATLYLDAVGFRITTDQSCGGSSDTIATVPLTDTYDATKLSFVSASPAESQVSSGQISWNNLGPLYAGMTKTVTVAFRGLAVASATPISNTANSYTSAFGDGTPANPVTSTATATLQPTGSIGDYVYSDVAGSPPLPNVTVQLRQTNCTGTILQTQLTGADGKYLFSALRDGAYCVTVDTTTFPGGYTNVTNSQKRGTTDNQSGVITISGANDVLDADFGYQFTQPRLQGTVWHDWNKDGSATQQTGEEGFSGVKVYATHVGCTIPACPFATTDANGRYTITGLSTGVDYTVVVDTATLPGGASGWTASYATSMPINLTTNRIASADFSYYNGALSIGDTVYADWNGNGVQDGGENGLPDVTLRLYHDWNGSGTIDTISDTLIATATTGAAGYYTFANQPAAHYLVILDRTSSGLPSDYTQTQQYGQSGVCITCTNSAVVNLSASLDTVDFGYKPVGFATIGDLVFNDANHNGLFDIGESGIPTVTVWLSDTVSGAGVATTTTGSSGTYSFANLAAGTYTVTVKVSDSHLPTDGYGSTYVPSTASVFTVTVASGDSYLDADFGFSAGGVIGNLVWLDNNGDGTPNTTEPGIPGVTVNLYKDGVAYATTTTNSSGIYHFVSLPAGNYTVQVVSPGTNYTMTGSPAEISPPACVTCSDQANVTLAAGQVNYSFNWGFKPAGVIGSTLWIDANNDGQRQDNEAGVPGITVTLKNSGGSVISTTVTDSDGYYSFGGLADGNYTVVVDPTNLPSGLAQTYGKDGVKPDAAVTITGGADVLDVNFGYRYQGAYQITGTTFFDAGDDGGLYNPATDTPWGGITVYLWRDGAQIGSTTTDASGYYTFTNLSNGDYAVSVNRGGSRVTSYTMNTPTPNPYYLPVTINNANQAQKDFGFYAELDYGDLPAGYNNDLLLNEGARHVMGGLTLGANVSADPDGKPDAAAAKDTYDDGVVHTTGVKWAEGTDGASVDVTVNGCTGTCYLSAWVDWNNDNDFEDAGERVLLDYTVTTGKQTITFDVPTTGSIFPGTYNLRFRLYAAGTNGLASPLGLVTNGEVEDYQWGFSPTAVTLAGFKAAPRLGFLLAWPALLAALLGAGLVYTLRRRRAA